MQFDRNIFTESEPQSSFADKMVMAGSVIAIAVLIVLSVMGRI